jgi:hypothetical protein
MVLRLAVAYCAWCCCALLSSAQPCDVSGVTQPANGQFGTSCATGSTTIDDGANCDLSCDEGFVLTDQPSCSAGSLSSTTAACKKPTVPYCTRACKHYFGGASPATPIICQYQASGAGSDDQNEDDGVSCYPQYGCASDWSTCGQPAAPFVNESLSAPTPEEVCDELATLELGPGPSGLESHAPPGGWKPYVCIAQHRTLTACHTLFVAVPLLLP